jgi:uncharacterized protein YlxP (DUF503 family)
MVVGVLRLTLSLHGARSLKDKRQVLRKLIDRVRARYNVSIAEVGDNDLWQRMVLGVVVVSNDHAFVDEVLAKVTRDVEGGSEAQLIDRELEIETYSEMHKDIADKPMLDEIVAGLSSGGSADPGDEWDAEAEERALQAEALEQQAAEALALAEQAAVRAAASKAARVPETHLSLVQDPKAAPGGPANRKGPETGGWLKEEDFE